MKQALLEQPQRVVIRDVEKPAPAEGQVLIQVREIGVCGSDIHAYYGKHPYIRCPIVQGHEFSGTITALGRGTRGWRVGQDVTVMPQLTCGTCHPCRHGTYNICNSLRVIGCQADGAAQEFFAADARLLMRLPRGMSHETGAMVEPAAVAAHALSRLGDGRGGGPRGKAILVLGAGPIGNLVAQTARGLGARSVMITDVSDFRLDIARQCGVEHCVNTGREDLGAALDRCFGGDRADATLECVGSPVTMEQAITHSRKGTDIVVVGVFGQKPALDAGLVQDKELRLIGTLMYRRGDYATAIRLLRSGAIRTAPLVTHRFPLTEYAAAYALIDRDREHTMKVVIDVSR